MNRDDLMALLLKKIRHSSEEAVNVFKIMHHKHGGIGETDISPNQLRSLLRIVLKVELDTLPKPSAFVDVLTTICRRKKSPMQVDLLVYNYGITVHNRQSIPYVIAKSSRPTAVKLVWMKAIVNHSELNEYFDWNRPVGAEGNLVVNSYASLHLHDIEWYEYLLLDLKVAVNTTIRKKTLKDFVLRDMQNSKAPSCAKKLLDLLEHCGGKTRVELKH